MAETVYRREVLDARRQSWLGEVSLTQPLSWWVLTVVAASVVAVMLCLLVFGSHTRQIHVAGRLQPAVTLPAVAPVDAIVTHVLVADGEHIAQGQPIMLLALAATAGASDLFETVAGDEPASLPSGASALDRSVIDKYIAEEASHLAWIQQALNDVETELAASTRALVHASENAPLGHDPRALKVRLERQRRSLLALGTAWRELAAQASALRHLLAVTATAPPASYDGAGDHVVMAPSAGIVVGLDVRAGDMVRAGDELLQVQPRGGQLQALLQVPDELIGYVEQGRRVRLRYDALQGRKARYLGGRVAGILRNVQEDSAVSDAAPSFQVVVELDEQSNREITQLHAGMLLQAQIIEERRRLYEWLFAPLLTVGDGAAEERD